MTQAAPELTVIATCYNEEETIREFHQRLSKTLREMGRSHEIIYVNDGSRDKTFERLQELFGDDESIAVAADLMFNVGQPTAITVDLCMRGAAKSSSWTPTCNLHRKNCRFCLKPLTRAVCW